MATTYTLCAILVVACVISAVTADKGKKGKMMGMLSCLTTESVKTIMDTVNTTMAACKAELGLNANETAETATTGRTTRETKHWKPNMCFMECMWRKNGLVKDGSLAIEDYAKTHFKPEFQEKVASEIQSCLTKEALSATYTFNKEDQCKSLEKYGKCFHTASKVCKAGDSSSSEEN